MYAYRTISGVTAIIGQDDGGDRLARLLDLSGCQNVVIVVSRRYGGVKLSSDRWKRISEVAKDALDKGGFIQKQDQSRATRKKSKKK